MRSIIYNLHLDRAPALAIGVIRTSTILVVDDERSILMMVRDVLEDEGYCVLTAKDGLCALELAHTAHPDLIITDLMMPVMSGRVLLRMLGTTSNTAAIPVLLMTAAYQPKIDEGFVGIITKPFQIDDLLTNVQHHTLDTTS